MFRIFLRSCFFKGAGFISTQNFRGRAPVRQKGPRILSERDVGGSCRLIDEKGDQMGVMEISEALLIAGEREVDLVEIAPNSDPRTCKLMDFGKFRYQQTKKNRGQKKPVNKRKEVKLRPKVGDHDFNVKVERARRFLGKGHKVLVTMMFRGREMVHVDLGMDLLQRFAGELEDCSKIEKEPSREARNRMNMILVNKG